jgi:lipopolysaccharide heptosyltransferase II
MKKILIANIFGIGDVLFTTPLIANIKKGIEGVSIDYLANSRAKPVVEQNPDVDEVLEYEKDDYTRLWGTSKIKCFLALKEFYLCIKRKKYDAVLDFTLSREFGLLFFLAGIKKRIGFNYKKRGIFLTDQKLLKGFEGKHVIDHYLELLDFLGLPADIDDMKLTASDESEKKINKILRDAGRGKGKLIALIPGGGASWGQNAGRKRWPMENFLSLGHILNNGPDDIVILGDSREKPLCSKMATDMENKPLLVKNDLDLSDYIALIKKCDLVVCNDGGPLHIAVALGVKTVSTFGPVDEKVYGPFPVTTKHKVVTNDKADCRPCYKRFKLPDCSEEYCCLEGIGVEAVLEVCRESLGSG